MEINIASAHIYSAGYFDPATGTAVFGIYSASNTSRNLNGSAFYAEDSNSAELYGIYQALLISYSFEDRRIFIHPNSQYIVDIFQSNDFEGYKVKDTLKLCQKIHDYGGVIQVKEVSTGNFENTRAQELAASALESQSLI